MRVCFQLQVKPDRLGEYKERHAAVWPEMRAAMAGAGWRNYSIFAADNGMIIGYVEVDDFDASLAAMANTDVNARWQAEMAEYFVGLDELRPDEGLVELAEIFHLD